MKTSYVPILFALCILFPGLSAAQQTDMSAVVDSLDSIFNGWDSSETPGCAIGVAKEGVPVITRAYGMADLEHLVPNTPATIFEAGSVSKQFVTASIILLSLEGKLSLDDDIRTFVSELPDYEETITIRHLMNHTSGLRDWGSVAAISGWGRSDRTHNHDHVLDILGRQSALNFSPGERYSYSNSGYNLMAVVVERVSGKPFAEFSARNLFEPLGMTQTQWRDDYTRIVRNRSSAYTGSEGSETFSINRPIEHVHGNGGLLTTVGDLLLWKEALRTEFFGEEFMDELLKQGVLGNGRTISYASAVRIDSDHGHRQVTHTGATSGYRAYLSWYPDSSLSVALLCNVTGANPGNLGSSVSGLFLEREDAAEAEQPAGVEISEEVLKAKTGIYADQRNHRPLEFEFSRDSLRIGDGAGLIPRSENRFQLGNTDTEYRFEQSSANGTYHVQVLRQGYEEEVYLPVRRADVSDVQKYTGVFTSPDAETELRITAEGDSLTAHRRPADSFDLKPVYEDAFQADGFGLLRFMRDEQDEITGFVYSSSRVYELHFYRQEN